MLRAESDEAERVRGAAQAAHEARRGAGEAQRADRLGRAGRRRRQPPRGLHLDGARQEDAAPDERRYARVVGDSGRPDPLHDRRPGAVRRVEGLSRAGAVSQHVHDGDGRRSAVAALRSEHREGPQDVSDGREARAGAGLRLRAGARARARAPTPKATSRSSISTRSRPAPTRRAGSCTTTAPSRTSSSAPAFRHRRSPTKGTSTRRAPSSGSSSSNKIRYNIEGLPVFEADQGDIVYVPKMRFHLASFAGDRAVMPPRDERLHGPVAFVRGGRTRSRTGAGVWVQF